MAHSAVVRIPLIYDRSPTATFDAPSTPGTVVGDSARQRRQDAFSRFSADLLYRRASPRPMSSCAAPVPLTSSYS